VVTGFVYDCRDQLVEVTRGGALLESYGYSFDGLRTTKSGPEGLFRFVYDDQSLLLQTDLAGNTISKYEWGPDRLLALSHATEGRQFYLFDALGSVASLSKPDGTLQARYRWDAWGNLRSQSGDSFNLFGFTGHQRDEETGLYYAKARFYDPEVGRFLSEDPLNGEPQTPPSLHRYLYAFDQPTFYVDPSGKATLEVGGRKIWIPDLAVTVSKTLLNVGIGAQARASSDRAAIDRAGSGWLPGPVRDAVEMVKQTSRDAYDAVARMAVAYDVGGRRAFQREQGAVVDEQLGKLHEHMVAQARSVPGVATLDEVGKAYLLHVEGRQGAAERQLGAALVQGGEDVALTAAGAATGGVLRSARGMAVATSETTGVQAAVGEALDVAAAQSRSAAAQGTVLAESHPAPAVVRRPALAGPSEGFSRYVEAERNISSTPGSLAELEDALRRGAAQSELQAKAAGFTRRYGRLGTEAHTRLEPVVVGVDDAMSQAGSRFSLRAEEFRDPLGNVVGRRAPGSLGVDAVAYENLQPIRGFDLKTGRPWTPAELKELERRFGVPIVQIKIR